MSQEYVTLGEILAIERLKDARRDRARQEFNRRNLTSLALRQVIRDKFAWPGGYAFYGVTSDGACLCCECMRSEYRSIAYARRHQLSDGWRVVAVDTTDWCEERTVCDHCNADIFNPED